MRRREMVRGMRRRESEMMMAVMSRVVLVQIFG